MYTLIFVTILASVFTGLVARYKLRYLYADNPWEQLEITWLEFILTSIVITALVAPLTVWGGWKLAVNNHLEFNEYWNGWEQTAVKTQTICRRDGWCHWSYACDPYVVCVPVCTSNGKTTSCHTVCTIHYHSCPYCTEEWGYTITTTLGDYSIAKGRFPENPRGWRGSIPAAITAQAGVGDPPFWAAARSRIDSGAPGPVTQARTYRNYFLASDQTILKQYRGDIDAFRTHNLIPDPSPPIYNFYNADKLVGVGLTLDPLWQKRLSYLNAALGWALQGDVHVVVIRHKLADENPTRFKNALKAAWVDKAIYKKNATSQNGIVVVIGTDGTKVTWAQAFTGMPMGNERTLDRIEHALLGKPLDPDSVLGKVKYNSTIHKVVVGGQQNLATILLLDSDTKFVRTKMENYLYLKNEITPSRWEQFFIWLIAFIACGALWFVAANIEI